MGQNGRIEPGEPLASAISARAWNRAQDAADRVLGVGGGLSGIGPGKNGGGPNVVTIFNGSGVDIKAAGILGINGLAIQPILADELPTIIGNPVLSGNTPTESANNNRFAITLEPIAAGKYGRAAVCGVVAFRLVNRDPAHDFANVKTNDTERLQSASCGSLVILARSNIGRDGWIWAIGAM